MAAPDSTPEGYFLTMVMVGYMGGSWSCSNHPNFQKLLLKIIYGGYDHQRRVVPDPIPEGYFLTRVMVGYMGGQMVMMFNLSNFQKLFY